MIFQAIIFDFDGVIVDSETAANAALAEVLCGLGHAVTAEQAIERYSGLRWIDCHRRIVEERGLTISCEALMALTEVALRGRDIPAIPGVDAFLAGQSHRRLAVASSSEKPWLDATLERLGLARHFGERVFSAARLPRGKPHPDVYLQAARQLGVDPGACLVIEDHPIGVAAGAAAGMTVIALLAASHIRDGHESAVRSAGAAHVARNYAEVTEIVRRIELTP